MKRPRNDTPLNATTITLQKRQSKVHPTVEFFERLPHEVILKILSKISRRELIALASTSKRLRIKFQPYLFRDTKVSWNHLVTNWRDYNIPVLIKSPHLIEGLRLTDNCSKNEWTFPFAELFSNSKLPNLVKLSLPTSGSTSFLKYSNQCSRVIHLSLHTVRPGSGFNMEHVSPFKELKELTLRNFEIESFEENCDWCPSLSVLSLENCTWCYPFRLENFGREKITSLRLDYANAFVISERFKLFLNNPNFTRLHHLSITNNEKNLKLTLSVHIMNLIGSIPTLKTVKLNGNIYNETIHNFTTHDLDNCENYLALNDVKVFYSSFLHDH